MYDWRGWMDGWMDGGRGGGTGPMDNDYFFIGNFVQFTYKI